MFSPLNPSLLLPREADFAGFRSGLDHADRLLCDRRSGHLTQEAPRRRDCSARAGMVTVKCGR